MTHRPPVTRGVGAAHERQRRNILEAVFAIIDEQGADQVTVRNVAKAAGISPGRVQHYFATKDALLAAAFAAVNEAGAENVRRRLDSAGVESGEAVVAAILTELVPADPGHQRLARIAQSFEVYALTRPELGRRLRDDYDRLIALIAGLLPLEAGASSRATELTALANGLGWLVVTGSAAVGEARRTVEERVREVFAEGVPGA